MSKKLLCACFAMSVIGLQAGEIPMKDFFRNPEKAMFQLSPDGSHVAFLAPYKRRLNVFVQDLDGKPQRVTGETARDITGGYFWKGNSRIVYVKDFKGDENYHLVSVGTDGSGLKDLTPFDGVRAEIIDDLPDNDSEIIVGLNRRNKEIFDAYRLNVVTGETKLIAENPGNIAEWYTDHDGRLRAAVTSDGVNHSLLFRQDESSPFKTVLTTNFKEDFETMFFTFDNRHLYGLSNIGRDKKAFVELDPETGKEVAVIYENPDVDVSVAAYSHKRKVLAWVTYVTWKKQRFFLDQQSDALFKKVAARLPGLDLNLESNNKAEDKFVFSVYSDRIVRKYYLYDAASDKLTMLADACPWLDSARLAEMKPISFISRDGLTVNGYLTVPAGREAKNLPVVVNPHGGPWYRDSWGFNPEVQFLANRGYAVLQINFRGSTGYGRKFWEASFKQWGRTMQNDITDGVNYLVAQGIADPKRIAIYGGSYGGYATLAGLAFTPDLYACGIDYVGVSNLLTFMKTIPPYWKPFIEMMYEQVGNPATEEQLLRDASPVFHADRIKAPLLVAQGAKDPRVNINESNQIVESLRKRGVSVEYMVKDNEGHGFANEENRFDFYKAMEKFLKKHLR